MTAEPSRVRSFEAALRADVLTTAPSWSRSAPALSPLPRCHELRLPAAGASITGERSRFRKAQRGATRQRLPIPYLAFPISLRRHDRHDRGDVAGAFPRFLEVLGAGECGEPGLRPKGLREHEHVSLGVGESGVEGLEDDVLAGRGERRRRPLPSGAEDRDRPQTLALDLAEGDKTLPLGNLRTSGEGSEGEHGQPQSPHNDRSLHVQLPSVPRTMIDPFLPCPDTAATPRAVGTIRSPPSPRFPEGIVGDSPRYRRTAASAALSRRRDYSRCLWAGHQEPARRAGLKPSRHQAHRGR